MKEVKDDILVKNRDSKIESIVEGKEYVEEKLEDDPRYQQLMKKGVQPLPAPSGKLFYLDFKYGDDIKETHFDGHFIQFSHVDCGSAYMFN